MGRRYQKANKSANSDDGAGVCISNGTSDNDTMKNTRTQRWKSFSKENTKPQEINKKKTQSCDIFPFWLPWILFPLTLILRLVYVLEPTNWWILHPDEIFQSMEVAHSDAFGYGFRPYEYLPPPSHDLMNSTDISEAQAHAIKHGMFGLRSFLLPKLLAIVMTIFDKFGSIASPFLVVKVFHVTMTSLLPIVVYKFSVSLQQSRDTACLSAILVCSSLTLNVFATHTFINSFLSCVFFLALIPLMNSLKLIDTPKSVKESKDKNIHDSLENSTKANGVYDKTKINGGIMNQRNEETDRALLAPGMSGQSRDINLNIIKYPATIGNMRECKNCWLKYSVNINTYIFQEGTNSKHTGFAITMEIMTGLSLALCVYIRVDLSIILFFLLASNSVKHFGNFLQFVLKFNTRYLLGLISGIVIGGYCDYVTYGKWFLSPYQWYKFNVLNNSAGNFFGVQSVYFYLLKLYQNEPLACVSVMIIFVDIIQDLRTYSIKNSHFVNNQNLIIFISLLLAYSLNSHKELRFIHNAVIFMYMSVSVAIFSVFKRFSQNQNSRQYSIFSVYLFIALFTSSHFYNFCNMRNADKGKWSYGKIGDSHETNMCLNFVRQQKGVSGVFMDRSVYMSGAYSILHHDVPIFALNIFEFMEYKSDKHIDEVSNLDLSQRKYKGYSTFKNISDFISIYNAQYLFRKVRGTPKYNYLILQTDTNFNDAGYDEVFRIGNSKVVFRTFEKKKEIKIQTEIANAKMFFNATILEYEGSWLKHYGLYSKAEQRLLMANKIDSHRIDTFRILLEMYSKLKYADDFNSVLKACVQVFSSDECRKPYVPVGLHYGYYEKP